MKNYNIEFYDLDIEYPVNWKFWEEIPAFFVLLICNIFYWKKSFKKEWYKKYNNNYYVLEGSTYNNLIIHWNSNINLARKIARENNFTEC